MLEILKFCFSSGWNLICTILVILALGYSIRETLEGVASVIAAKVMK
jgi:hypothetical protein